MPRGNGHSQYPPNHEPLYHRPHRRLQTSVEVRDPCPNKAPNLLPLPKSHHQKVPQRTNNTDPTHQRDPRHPSQHGNDRRPANLIPSTRSSAQSPHSHTAQSSHPSPRGTHSISLPQHPKSDLHDPLVPGQAGSRDHNYGKGALVAKVHPQACQPRFLGNFPTKTYN